MSAPAHAVPEHIQDACAQHDWASAWMFFEYLHGCILDEAHSEASLVDARFICVAQAAHHTGNGMALEAWFGRPSLEVNSVAMMRLELKILASVLCDLGVRSWHAPANDSGAA